MSDGSGYKRIGELVRSLTHRSQALEGGALGPEGLEAACEDARELYERLVVLRHKARELVAGRDVRVDETGAPLHVVHEAPAIRLDTRPIDERQTSLIDAIAETEKKRSPKKKSEAAAPTVADRLGQAPIKDLGKAIAVSEKFWFINELFRRDASAYELAIKRINGSKDVAEARAFLQVEVVGKLDRPPAEDVLAAFTDLVERRFL